MAEANRSLLQSTLFKIGASCILTPLLLLLILPNLSSTTWFTNTTKQIINNTIPGKLDFSHLTLSWLNGLQLRDLVYEDQDNGYNLTIKQISTSKGLLALATNYKDAGTINIDRPQVTVHVRPPQIQTNTPAKAVTIDKARSDITTTTTTVANDIKTTKKTRQPPPASLLPQIRVQLLISQGSLVAIAPDNSQKEVIKDLDLQLKLDGKKGIVEYLLSFANDQGSGQVRGKGKIALPQQTVQQDNDLESNATLEIHNWQIADLLDIAASLANVPKGKGILNGNVHITASGQSTREIIGNLTGQNIQLYGGPLLSDTPSINDFSIDWNVLNEFETIKIKNFSIQSPLVTASVSGLIQHLQIQTLTTQTHFDIAEIFSQFPNSLNVKKDVSVTDGKIDIQADISSSGSATHFVARAHLNHLIGSAANKAIAWKTPVDISVQARRNKGTLTIDQFAIQSSFVQANGHGNSEAIQLQIGSDIDAALQELGKFITLDGWASRGKLALDLNITNNKNRLRKVVGSIKIADFELSHNGTVLSPAATLTAELSSDLQLNAEMLPIAIRNSKLDITSWLGSGAISLDNFIAKTDDSPAILTNATATGSFQLQRITSLLQSLETLPRDRHLAGTLQLDLHITGEHINQPTILLTAKVSPFTYQSGDKSLTDEQLSLEIEASADLRQQNFTIKSLVIGSDAINFNSSATMETQNEEIKLVASGTTRVDLHALGEQLKSFADLQLEMSGVSDNPFTLQAATTEGLWRDTAQHAQFSTSFHAEKIKGYGLSIKSLEIPVQLQKSLAKIDIKASVNRGLMSLSPRIDFTGTSPLVTLPANSTLLKEVGLTGEMSNDLLAKVHPLFKGVALTVGTINLDMQHLSWPVDKEMQQDVTFAGTLTFNDVKLQAGTLLTPLLAIMKIDDNEIELSNQPMTFIGKDGRVTCSPLKATINGYSLILEGSVGFDQSLDYTAKIPITRKMVSGEVYKYLQGTFITVPLTGSVSKPSVSKAFVQKALADLILQVGKKQLGDQVGRLLQNLFQ